MSEVNIPQALGGQFEATFRSLGIPFELVDEFDIADITMNPAVQVRQSDIAPIRRVHRYEEQMRAGAVFPPMVLRKHDKALIDGNTRMAAYNRMGRAVTPVYLVEPRNDEQALILGGALNQLGGADLDQKDAMTVALLMARRGTAVATISKTIGISAAKITRWTNVEQGRQHAERVGAEADYLDLSQNNQEHLAKIARDEPFKKLLKTLAETKPVVHELKDLVKRVNAAGSDDEAVEDIHRTALAWPESDGHKDTAKSPALAAYAPIKRMVDKDPAWWVDRGQTERLLPMWQQLRDLAKQVIALYEE